MEVIKLDLIPGKKMPSLHASQYDDGREHGIDLFENGIAYKLDGTETLTINEHKGDDCICSLDIENTFADSNHIVFASTEQMCAVWGNNICELVIAKGEKTIGTLNFILEVEPSPTENGIESESEIRNLERQIEAITEEVIGDDYYTKTQTDEAISEAIEDKADTTYVDTELAKKADKTDTYTKSQVNNALNTKMNKANPTGTGSLKVGSGVNASGTTSTALGYNATASGNVATAIGNNTTAEGNQSVAEGNRTIASGDTSHASGRYTKANHRSQIAYGEWNVEDDSTTPATSRGNYVEIVGNGTSENNRSNARTLDWSGNETLAGNLTFNGNKSLTSEISRLDGRIDTKANASDVYTKSQTDNLLNDKANASDVYTKQATDALLNDKADVSDLPDMSQYYDKGEVDDLLDDKADADNTYTKAQVDDIVYNILPDDTASGSVANFATSLELPIKSLEVDVNAVQSAGTPTPASPLPISGWSEISLVKCGANLCNQADIVGAYPTKYTVDTDGSIKTVGNLGLADVLWTNKSKVSGVLNVVFVSKYQNTGSVGIRPKVIYTDGTTSVIYTTNTQDYSVKTLLTTSSKTVEKIVVDYGTNNPTNFFLEVTLDTSASTYEPYNGNTEVINLGGTYYGGHFTQDKDGHRQLVLTYSELLDMGDLTWANFSPADNIFRANVPNCKSPADNADRKNGFLCSIYPASSNVSITANMTDKSLLRFGGYLVLRDTSYSDYTELASSLSGAKLIYELATPIIIDLPDGEPIITLNGTNNIYADTGDSTVVFKCSVNDYINAHQSSGAKSLGGVFLGSSNRGSEEEPKEESEDTEKVREIDDPKEEIKTIGDMKKLGGE